ncbi:MAG: cupin domain-containing protein [Ruminococcaceae bacterium]|nr:cupin domain-containing protein [Oscillospiraceae bacterium]
MIKYGNSATEKNLGGGVCRKILAFGEEIMAVEVSFEEGAVGSVHSHPHSQISYVLEGRFEARIGGEVKEISQGDSYYTEPDMPHGVVCLEKGKLLDVFTPMRMDFLS